MNAQSASRWAWPVCGLSFLLLAAGAALFLINVPVTGWNPTLVPILFGTTLAYAPLGALLASRRPKNAAGWILLGYGLFTAISVFMGQYILAAFVTAPGSLPAAGFVAWIHGPLYEFSTFFFTALFLFLFPTGHPPGPRWKPFIWAITVIALIEAASYMFTPGQLTASNRGTAIQIYNLMPNPTGIAGLPQLLQAPNLVFVGILLAIIPALGALLWRLLRSYGDERQQVKWLAYTALLFMLIALPLYAHILRAGLFENLGYELSMLVLTFGFPAAATVAILKYHLYDIDIVINKSLVFGALAVFITGVYVLIVAGLGSIVGSRGRPNLALSILATAIVAVAFQPVRGAVERMANRLIYGKRATPYEVLSRFTDGVSSTYASEEILPRMAQVLSEGTGAARADVWLRLGEHVAPAASWPQSNGPAISPVPFDGNTLPSIPGVSRIVPVRHQGEVLGALSIAKRPGEALTPVEDGLLKDLAAQAGLVLRNVRLTAELRARLDEISRQSQDLRESRQRIVATQDAERRRLERNIHDGAQQHLVALTVKLRLAASQARRDPGRALKTVKALDAETDDALSTLRDLARGIYPPVLREQGLIAALRTQVSRMDLPVEVEADAVGRYQAETEAAVYFSCLEALQNVSKHADARRIRLALEQRDGSLIFAVTDDGKGFDPRAGVHGSGLQNMADRIEALGGTLTVSARVGGGTTIAGRVPAAAFEQVS